MGQILLLGSAKARTNCEDKAHIKLTLLSECGTFHFMGPGCPLQCDRRTGIFYWWPKFTQEPIKLSPTHSSVVILKNPHHHGTLIAALFLKGKFPYHLPVACVFLFSLYPSFCVTSGFQHVEENGVCPGGITKINL